MAAPHPQLPLPAMAPASPLPAHPAQLLSSCVFSSDPWRLCALGWTVLLDTPPGALERIQEGRPNAGVAKVMGPSLGTWVSSPSEVGVGRPENGGVAARGPSGQHTHFLSGR